MLRVPTHIPGRPGEAGYAVKPYSACSSSGIPITAHMGAHTHTHHTYILSIMCTRIQACAHTHRSLPRHTSPHPDLYAGPLHRHSTHSHCCTELTLVQALGIPEHTAEHIPGTRSTHLNTHPRHLFFLTRCRDFTSSCLHLWTCICTHTHASVLTHGHTPRT